MCLSCWLFTQYSVIIFIRFSWVFFARFKKLFNINVRFATLFISQNFKLNTFSLKKRFYKPTYNTLYQSRFSTNSWPPHFFLFLPNTNINFKFFYHLKIKSLLPLLILFISYTIVFTSERTQHFEMLLAQIDAVHSNFQVLTFLANERQFPVHPKPLELEAELSQLKICI
jgi:hypothetical protein